MNRTYFATTSTPELIGDEALVTCELKPGHMSATISLGAAKRTTEPV